MEKTIIKECSNCAVWQPLSDKQLEIKGFCYKETILPEPKKRTDSCGDWQEYTGDILMDNILACGVEA